MNKWLLGIPYELAFWESIYSNQKALRSVINFSHLGSAIHLDGFDVQAFLLSQPEPQKAVVLDVGCGMTFFPGNYLTLPDGTTAEVNLHYVDPLAEYYNLISQRHKVQVPMVEFGMMEYLSAFYPQSDVTLIIIQNALDHSANPVKGVIEAVEALQPGGVLYLNHHPNEAEYESYRGFHQFNIDIRDGQLIIWNRSESHNISELLAGFAVVDTLFVDANPVAVIRKTAEVPPHLLDRKADIRRLSKAMLDFTQTVNSPSHMLRYHCRLAYYRLAQRVSKLFSWQTRQKIKQLFRRS